VALLIKAAKDISAKYDAIVELMECLKVREIHHVQPAAGK
jgi:hypothetical protein